MKILIKLAKRIIKILFKGLVGMFIRCIPNPHYFFQLVCECYEKKSDVFCRYKLYPKFVDGIPETQIETETKKGELAIVIQGPIDSRSDFTNETLKLYKILFPNAILIVSTWSKTPQHQIDIIKENGCYVILNEEFASPGFCNINYQLCTTMAGLRLAKEKGAEYCMKIRTDMRINRDFCFEYLKSILRLLPISGSSIPLRERIITVSGFPGQSFFPNWIQDFFYFGITDDLINFFDIPYDKRKETSSLPYFSGPKKVVNGEEFCKIIPPEKYITEEFLKKYGLMGTTVKDFWAIIKDYFVVIDFSDLNLLWDKYGLYSEHKYEMESVQTERITDPYMNISSNISLPIITGELCYRPKYERMKVSRKF